MEKEKLEIPDSDRDQRENRHLPSHPDTPLPSHPIKKVINNEPRSEISALGVVFWSPCPTWQARLPRSWLAPFWEPPARLSSLHSQVFPIFTKSKINISKKITGFLFSLYLSHFHLLFCTSYVCCYMTVHLQWLHHKRCYETALSLAIYFVTRALFEDNLKAG
jgi:hypothetical protein